jgi:hypothetical protein
MKRLKAAIRSEVLAISGKAALAENAYRKPLLP